MSVFHTRRDALKLGLSAASLMALRANASPAPALRIEPLTDRLALVSGGACNVVVMHAEEGLLLVDGGAAADASGMMRLLQRTYPGSKVRVLFNTHWHLANSGLDAEARRQGAEIIAHENTRLWMSTVVNSRWEDRVYRPQPENARPTKTFYDGVQTLTFGGERIEYALMPQAHTDGDIYVRFTDSNVIATGDVLAPGRYPIVDSATNGWLGGMHQGLKQLAALGRAGTRYVPGLGPVSEAAALKAQQDLCFAVLSRIGENYYKGETWEQLLASAPTREFDADHGDPSLFLRQSYESAWYHVNEIRRVAR